MLYRSRLKEDGLLFFHTSNRLSDISSVVVRLAEDAGMSSLFIKVLPEEFSDRDYQAFITASTGVLVGPDELITEIASQEPKWQAYHASPRVKLWSDDYNNIVAPLISNHKGKGYGVDIEREPRLQTASTE